MISKNKAFICFFFILIISCSERVIHKWEDGFEQNDKLVFFQVSEVIDNNHIRLSDGRVIEYLGIKNIPKDSIFFKETYNANLELIKRGGYKVLLEFEEKSDKHSAYVFSPINQNEDRICCFVNKELILFGYSTVEAVNHKYHLKFLEIQDRAKKSKIGIWRDIPSEK